MERIKIAYAWIGPRGPIWNTELPNVLSFANVADGAKTTSHMWWADDAWTRIFRPKQDIFELYPSVHLGDRGTEDVFIYPFSLTWRIPMTSYFLGKTGILEFSHVTGNIIWHVRNGNGFFLIDLNAEAFMQDDQLLAMSTYFRDTHGVPLNKVIYITGCMNADVIYEDFCHRNNIPNDPVNRLNIITYPSAKQIFATYLNTMEGGKDEPIYDPEKVPEKLFLMWNRRYRPHRIELATKLDQMGLVDRSYVSMGRIDPENPGRNFYKEHEGYMYNMGIGPEDALKLYQKLPLVIDGETNVVRMCEDFDNSARRFYQNSLVSIVTETNFDLPQLTLTEKSFKPSKEKHPFIIVGVPGALKAMRDMGFKTFSEFWSEEYDNIQNPPTRLQEIARLCQEISMWDREKILDFRRRVKPILEHNYRLLWEDVAGKIADKIHDIVRKNSKE